jgi:putative membrane protein
MFLELLLFLFIGIFLGVIAGLVPGLHPNTIAFLLLSISPLLNIEIISLVALLVGCEISNAFIGFIPSILLSAPEESTALATLPGQKFLMMGRGYEAIVLSVYGGIASVMIIAVLFPAFVIFIPKLYTLLKPIILILLLATIFHLFWTSRKKFWPSLAVFAFSAVFGFLIFQLPLNSSEVLFPALCGLFALSSLALSSNSGEIPDQELDADFQDSSKGKSSALSVFAGLSAGILPGVGSSEVTVMTQELARIKNLKDFMISIGGITTAASIFSIISLWTLGNPRSGTSVALQALNFETTLPTLFLVFFMIIAAAGISALLTLFISRLAVRNMHRIKYSKLAKMIFASLLVLIIIFTGFTGILIAATGFSIGIFCIKTNARRSLMMGTLIFPTLLILAGV